MAQILITAVIDAQDDASSELQLGSSPVPSLSVVPDFVISLVSAPVGHRSVLLDLFPKSHLLSECLDGTLSHKNSS